MKLYGLLGKTLTHSFSKNYFDNKFDKMGINAQYQLFEMEKLEDLHLFAEKYPELKGLNVTIPYKREVLVQLDGMSKVVEMVGSANVIKIVRLDGKIKLFGYNTDVIGFEKTLKPLIKGRKFLRALILGGGGVAHAVSYVLRKQGIYYCYITRNPKKIQDAGYSWINEKTMQDYQLIINTTPLGMYPKINACPEIPYQYITKNHILYDLIYNPEKTLFLKKGEENGAIIKNGLDMLKIQADESWEIWRK